MIVKVKANLEKKHSFIYSFTIKQGQLAGMAYLPTLEPKK